MNKWPIKWIQEIGHCLDVGKNSDSILTALHDIGALKDPPKPLEIWRCMHCGVTIDCSPQQLPTEFNAACKNGKTYLKYLNVLVHEFIHWKQVIE